MIDPKGTEAYFQHELSFGTAGIRGKMGMQVGDMNIYVIQKISQGLANYIRKRNDNGAIYPTIAIAYDTRLNSKEFAYTAASVFAGNNVKVYIFPNPASTPLLSFAITTLSLTAGIVITASHNPPEYNGYKVYWANGAQVISPHDVEIIKEINLINDGENIQNLDFCTACENKFITYIPVSLYNEYAKQTINYCFGNPRHNAELNLVYTPVYGTGDGYVANILQRRKFQNIAIVEKERSRICDLSTLPITLNPEDKSCFCEAIAIAKPQDQLIIATDPDADRLGVLIKNNGKWYKLSGNEIGILLLDYFLTRLTSNKCCVEGYFLTTIVSSLLAQKIAGFFGLKCVETIIGFRYMANKISELTSDKKKVFVFAVEESGGYLFGDVVKDKDAISTSMHFAEL